MKKIIITSAISLGLSAALYFGNESLHAFAYYILMAMTVLSALLVVFGQVKGEVAAGVREKVWFNAVLSAVQIAALIATEHPGLAASSFVVSAFIVAQAFSEKPEESKA